MNNILLSCMFTAVVCGGFCYLGFYMGSRFKIVEIKDTEQTQILNNNPHEHEKELKEALQKAEERYREQYAKQCEQFYQTEEATVPGEENG